MRHLVEYSMIGAGVFILTMSLFMKLGGFVLLLKSMMAISAKIAPVNETHLAWADVPLPMAIQATLNKIYASQEDGFLSVHHVDFTLKLSPVGQAGLPVTPAIFGPKDAGLDEPQRCVIRAGPLNYPSIISYVSAFFSFVIFLVALRFRFRKDSDDGPDPPHGQNHPLQFLGYPAK